MNVYVYVRRRGCVYVCMFECICVCICIDVRVNSFMQM